MGDEIRISKNDRKEEKKPIPAGAEIVRNNTSVNVEEIENGYLITKNIDLTYRVKGSDHTDYFYDTKRWYSEENPLEIKVEDKALADVFDSDDK